MQFKRILIHLCFMHVASSPQLHTTKNRDSCAHHKDYSMVMTSIFVPGGASMVFENLELSISSLYLGKQVCVAYLIHASSASTAAPAKLYNNFWSKRFGHKLLSHRFYQKTSLVFLVNCLIFHGNCRHIFDEQEVHLRYSLNGCG